MFQGGGPDAPPIAGVLGIGQCFVVRELARHGVIRNAHAHPYCYVPFKRLRRLMQCIDPELMLDESGGRWDQSKAIYRCLEKHLGAGAIFDGAFDVPLLVVSENAALQERLLGRVVPDEEGQVAGRPDEGWRTLPDGRRINLNG